MKMVFKEGLKGWHNSAEGNSMAEGQRRTSIVKTEGIESSVKMAGVGVNWLELESTQHGVGM